MHAMTSTMLTRLWLKFNAMCLFTIHILHLPTQDISLYTTGAWSFWTERVEIRCLYTCDLIIIVTVSVLLYL